MDFHADEPEFVASKKITDANTEGQTHRNAIEVTGLSGRCALHPTSGKDQKF